MTNSQHERTGEQMIHIHKDVVELVKYFRMNLEQTLSSKLYGLYLYNSVAMGNFEPAYSDIDFIVILNSSLSNDELEKLKMLHQVFAKTNKYGNKLDGMYLQRNMLTKSNKDIGKYPYVKDAILHEADYFDVNYVTWWSLKEYEMAIESPSLKDDLLEVDFTDVIETMKYNLNEYWSSKLETAELFNEDMWVEFAVVTLSRILFTLQDREIKSKSESCLYIGSKYPKWNNLIEEALAIRRLRPQSVINDINLRKNSTIDFIREMIEHGNAIINRMEKSNELNSIT